MKKARGFWPVLLLAAASRGEAAEIGYYTQPSLHGDRLIFVSEGDLWTADLPEENAEGPIIAHRLTSGDGVESHPVISPDGQWVAFTGQYEGNVDVYVMPSEGGAPRRLTFHPGPDVCLGWTPDGREVLFSSPRSHQFGHRELYRIATSGGMPAAYGFGPCTAATLNTGGKVIAFTPWSNENWTWKRYRGGTAPDIWIADLAADRFRPLTTDPANDLHPMWLRGRIYFLSDRSGHPNIHSKAVDGSDLQQHTFFKADDDQPTLIDGYDVRWPSPDRQRRGQRIAFVQGGQVSLLNPQTDTVSRLDVHLASDRVARRRRFVDPSKSITEFSLSPDAKRLLVGARGEILSLPIDGGRPFQLTTAGGAREWGMSHVDEESIILISDANGEQQIAYATADGSAGVSLLTDDKEAWLFPPVASPDGKRIAYADKTHRLHLHTIATGATDLVDRSEACEITDYRFSPDGQWIAYVKPLPNQYGMILLYSVRTGRTFPVSTGLHNDSAPRWGRKGKYLYFLSDAGLNPVLGELDFEHIYINTTRLCVVPLDGGDPPPIPAVAKAAGFDLEAWAKPAPQKEEEEVGEDDEPAAGDVVEEEDRIHVDTDGLAERAVILSVKPGRYSSLEATPGGVLFLSRTVSGMIDEEGEDAADAGATLLHFNLVTEKTAEIATGVRGFDVSGDGATVVYRSKSGFVVRGVAEAGEPKTITLSGFPLRIDVAAEWEQIFNEAWRLQRDFYFAPNLGGVNWEAMREKYAALLVRIGTRRELNDLIGELIGELRTSHTYVWGGDEFETATPVSVGLLGADIELIDGRFRLTHILPSQPWDESLRSPLAMPHLNVNDGAVLLAVNGTALRSSSNIYDLLQGQAGRPVQLVVEDAEGRNRRTIDVTALASEKKLRYAEWVESNRRTVEEASGGRLGYLHIPNMGGEGLVAFSRLFIPQIDKKGLVIDIRNNGGGFVSQMIIQRLARTPWAFDQPRHGTVTRYPSRSLHGHLAVIIDQHAGSDGDVFPESFRLLEMGPLIGTRTWGGVVGIRMDKPFVDMGVSSQPEFAWWEPKRGWSLENEGVSPDIEVPFGPGDHLAGRDPQLEKTIEVLLQMLEDDPKDPPSPPDWPVKTNDR